MDGLLFEKTGKVNCAQPQHDLCSPPTKTSHILQLSCPRKKKRKETTRERKDSACSSSPSQLRQHLKATGGDPRNPPGVSDWPRLLKTATTSTRVSEPAAFAESSCFIHPVLCPGVTRTWLAGRSGSCSG